MTYKELELIQWVQNNIHPFMTKIQSPWDKNHSVYAKYLQFMYDTRLKKIYGVRFTSTEPEGKDIVFNPVNKFKDKDLLEWIKEHVTT